MSYDYLLFKRPAGGEKPSMETIAENLATIGSVDEVRAEISRLFPAVRWQPPHDGIDSWFGLQGPPEFQVSSENGGLVTNFMASHIEPDEIWRLVKEMGLVALDLQSEEIIAG